MREKKTEKKRIAKTSLQIIRRTFLLERKKERKNVFCDEGVGKARAKEAKRKRDEENPEREGRSGKEILVLRGRSYEGGKRNRFGLQFER